MPAINKSRIWNDGELDSPANDAFEITPHDSNELTYLTRGLYVGGSGNIKVTTSLGVDITFTGVLAGSILPVRVKKVIATGTTATNLIGLY